MKKLIKLTSLFILSMFIMTNVVLAKENVLPEENTVYFEDVVNTGKDNGYSKKKEITKDDPHYGWKLGKFAISGFSSKKKDDKDNWILLKTLVMK